MTTASLCRRRVGLALAMLVALLAVAGLVDGSAGRTPAVDTPRLQLTADPSQFMAGNIIADSLFFDGLAMSAADVQAFLNDKGSGCVSGSMPCLKTYTQTTPSRAADAYCQAYAGAAGETAATILAKVGQACGISQRVLLVMLQKEQGLVRASGSTLTTTRYQKAMGYGCPDTAPCNTLYYGYFNQVYNAARRFKVYAANPDDYNYEAGRVNSILFNPTASCGRSDVFIENQATAGLYIYTPYQPNPAALAAGYGTAPCGAYGNRNFWLYYTDWFGSTQSPGGTAILARASAAEASLGAATSGVVCGLRDGGCFRNYQNGAVYWSRATGARIVHGAIGGRWAALGWEQGNLGYPTGEEVCGLTRGGCYQSFQGGSVYFAPAVGAHAVLGGIKTRWGLQGWEQGSMGYPTADERCGLAAGGCFQTFESGSIYWTQATAAHIVSGVTLQKWGTLAWERGVLGYPVGEATCGLADGGCSQMFQRGAVYSSATDGAFAIRGAVLTKWKGLAAEEGLLGYPTNDTICGLADSGCFQTFRGGAIYSSASTGAHVVSGDVRTKWAAQKWEQGPLGYPATDTTCGLADTGCSQKFQRGAIYVSASTGAHIVSGAILTRWAAQKAEQGPLGYPTAEQVCGLVRGGCFQTFQNGSVYSQATAGTHVVSDPVRTEWAAQTWERGPLGYPTGERICGLVDNGCYQHFEKGSVYSSTAIGVRSVLGPFRDAWAAQGWERGPLGYPTANRVCGLAGGGCTQTFQAGTIVWAATTGARRITGAIGSYWTAAGAQGGALGYPTTNTTCGLIAGGCYQHFQNGSIYWTPTLGAHAVTGAIRAYWESTGWERGSLGYPKQDAVTSGGQTTQLFEHGTLVRTASTGKVTVRR